MCVCVCVCVCECVRLFVFSCSCVCKRAYVFKRLPLCPCSDVLVYVYVGSPILSLSLSLAVIISLFDLSIISLCSPSYSLSLWLPLDELFPRHASLAATRCLNALREVTSALGLDAGEVSGRKKRDFEPQKGNVKSPRRKGLRGLRGR